MTDDDRLVGTLLSRRDAIQLIAATGLAFCDTEAASAQAPVGAACVVRPELEEGPYFVDGLAVRSDVRADSKTGTISPGVPLQISFSLAGLANGRCTPLRNAAVHIWQCDAVGDYSGVSGTRPQSAERDFLRGVQHADGGGVVRFTTIYPGWYPGRAVHTHFKIRTPGFDGQTYEFTSQLFYPDDLTDRIHADGPYEAHGRRDVTNARDYIYRSGGAQLLLRPTRQSSGSYQGSMAIALDLADTATGGADSRRRGTAGRGRGGRF
jgi:protocatechuate 3,4-dioxygenase beta subunit